MTNSDRLVIPQRLLARIDKHSSDCLPEECCGLIVGTRREAGESNGTLWSALDVVPTRNVAPPPRTSRYELDPLALLNALREASDRDSEIIGFYHSHPNHQPNPSGADDADVWADYVYVIVHPSPVGDVSIEAQDACHRRVRAWCKRRALDRWMTVQIISDVD